jgi:hypothetical protein
MAELALRWGEENKTEGVSSYGRVWRRRTESP